MKKIKRKKWTHQPVKLQTYICSAWHSNLVVFVNWEFKKKSFKLNKDLILSYHRLKYKHANGVETDEISHSMEIFIKNYFTE